MSQQTPIVKILLPVVILLLAFVGAFILVKSRQAPQKAAPDNPGVLVQTLEVEKQDHTVEVYLSRPSATFLLNLAGGYAVIQAEHMANADGNSTDYLMGTGPFMFQSYEEEESFTLVRNPLPMAQGFFRL